jgi:hypothetical protein
MADEQQMLVEHRRTWEGFLRLVTWSCVAIAITLAAMGIFLT